MYFIDMYKIVKSNFNTTLWVNINRISFAFLRRIKKKTHTHKTHPLFQIQPCSLYKCSKIHLAKRCELTHKIYALIWSNL